MQRMRRHLMEHNIYRWAANILGDLRELRMENQEFGHAGPEAVSEPDAMHRKLA
jgi:trehalose 6-phosphate synthase